MPTPEEELQSAVDRGELRAKDTAQIRRQIETTERRWIVMQVKEVAIAQSMSPAEFYELCEQIQKFITPPPAP